MSEQKNIAAGGRYLVAKPGDKPKQVEAPKHHAGGPRARAADGARLNRAEAEPVKPAAPAAKPAKS